MTRATTSSTRVTNSPSLTSNPDGFQVARVAAVEKLDPERPIKSISHARVEPAFGADDKLIEERFICAIIKQAPEVLVVVRESKVAGDAGLNPAVKSKPGWAKSFPSFPPLALSAWNWPQPFRQREHFSLTASQLG